jgi:catechol 2,3-dioxygenase-like lactoylglutathione lyase family enzyme
MAGEKTVGDITFRIRHTMMLVSDLDRSIDFYTRLLGMDLQRLRPSPDKNERVGYIGYGTEDEYPGLELIETGGPGHVPAMPKWYGHVAIYVSDLYTLSEKLKAFELGADDYLVKPFDLPELLARIRTKLRVKAAEDVIRRRNRELSLLPEIGKDLSARLNINELSDLYSSGRDPPDKTDRLKYHVAQSPHRTSPAPNREHLEQHFGQEGNTLSFDISYGGLSGNATSANGLSISGLSGNGLSGNGLSGNGVSGNGRIWGSAVTSVA